jgi:hypothetical protein
MCQAGGRGEGAPQPDGQPPILPDPATKGVIRVPSALPAVWSGYHTPPSSGVRVPQTTLGRPVCRAHVTCGTSEAIGDDGRHATRAPGHTGTRVGPARCRWHQRSRSKGAGGAIDPLPSGSLAPTDNPGSRGTVNISAHMKVFADRDCPMAPTGNLGPACLRQWLGRGALLAGIRWPRLSDGAHGQTGAVRSGRRRERRGRRSRVLRWPRFPMAPLTRRGPGGGAGRRERRGPARARGRAAGAGTGAVVAGRRGRGHREFTGR